MYKQLLTGHPESVLEGGEALRVRIDADRRQRRRETKVESNQQNLLALGRRARVVVEGVSGGAVQFTVYEVGGKDVLSSGSHPIELSTRSLVVSGGNPKNYQLSPVSLKASLSAID